MRGQNKILIFLFEADGSLVAHWSNPVLAILSSLTAETVFKVKPTCSSIWSAVGPVGLSSPVVTTLA